MGNSLGFLFIKLLYFENLGLGCENAEFFILFIVLFSCKDEDNENSTGVSSPCQMWSVLIQKLGAGCWVP